jgi:preprotein translocase subunit SecG
VDQQVLAVAVTQAVGQAVLVVAVLVVAVLVVAVLVGRGAAEDITNE